MLVIFLGGAATVGLTAYHLIKTRTANEPKDEPRSGGQDDASSGGEEASSDEPKGLPVEHGNVAGPEELHAHGELYFVPVGKQAIPVQSLADYYHEKFAIQVIVLPHVEARPADCIPQRHQCAAEELSGEMTTAYPEIARNPDSVMIALTDEDIFPRSLGWDFTYSLHSARIGIVSTRRMDPAFWGDPANDALRLTNTRQMLTKYVAMQYFHLPDSFDPTSVMYTPLTPDGGSDDIYESDLHSEESVNGRRGKPFPCLYFTYSYKTHKIKPDEPFLSDCEYHNPAHLEEENFETNLGGGSLSERTVDFHLDSTPPIEFRRGYQSSYQPAMMLGFGWGGSHTYNEYLSSNGLAQLTVMMINREAGEELFLNRLDSGHGFNPNSIYETQEDAIYGARMTWDSGKYKLQYRDGARSIYLPCVDVRVRCYWVGYEDGKGNSLQFDRGPNRELQRLTASDHQGVTFQSDGHYQIVDAKTTSGQHISYEYDAAGCLARVQRADGQIALYQYDSGHRMVTFSVARGPHAPVQKVLSNQYDAQGRMIRQTLAGVGVYTIEYLATAQDGKEKYASELRVKNPAGQVLTIHVGEEGYVVRTAAVRFQRAAE